MSPNIHSFLLPFIIQLLSFSQAHGHPTKDYISQPSLKPLFWPIGCNTHAHSPPCCLECVMVWSHPGPNEANDLGMEELKTEGTWVPTPGNFSISPGLLTLEVLHKRETYLVYVTVTLVFCHSSWFCILTNTLSVPSCLFPMASGDRVDTWSLVAIGSGLNSVLCWRARRLKSRCWPVWVPTWMLWGVVHFQAYSGGWQNYIPCSCRTDIPISLLAVCWRPLLAL